MEELDMVRQAILDHEECRHEDALRGLLGLFDGVLASEALARENLFITMFEWGQLAADYAPARAALARARDEQAARVLDGDHVFRSGRGVPSTRFRLVANMNRTLGETRATWELFVRLEALAPEQARRDAFIALPAIVEAGDFVRAERYLPRDPLGRLDELNALALRFPLFPPDRSSPRLATELLIFVRDVRLCAATWEGLGRSAEAQALREAALAGLPSDEMRALATRELVEPDAIIREQTARLMAMDEADLASSGAS